jgi:hypothetical protein
VVERRESHSPQRAEHGGAQPLYDGSMVNSGDLGSISWRLPQDFLFATSSENLLFAKLRAVLLSNSQSEPCVSQIQTHGHSHLMEFVHTSKQKSASGATYDTAAMV